jgi:hypothetical protein
LNPQQKEQADQLARLHQMKINTRLTALQSALSIMQLPSYSNGVEGSLRTDEKGETLATPKPVYIHRPQSVDHLTLIAMATDIEKYILGEIEKETNDFLNKPKPTIVPAKEMPSSNLRP